MKKLKKISLISSLCLLSVGLITPIAVSCSTDYNRRPTGLMEISKNHIQKVTYNDRELNSDQYDFEHYIIDYDHNTFNLGEYTGKQLNFYDSKYDGSNAENENLSSSKSNVLLIPSKIMYKNEWFTLQSANISFKTNSGLGNKVKSLRIDPCLDHPIILDIYDPLNNIVDMQNLPLMFNNGSRDWYGPKFWEPLGASLSEVTFNANIKSNEPNQLFALPVIKNNANAKFKLKNFSVPNLVTTILYETFEDIEYNGFLLPDSVKYIETPAFNYTFKSSCIPKKYYMDEIQGGLFKGMIIDTEIPNTVQTIGWDAFSGCHFESDIIRIPEGVKYIRSGAFSGVHTYPYDPTFCLPDSLEQIGEKVVAGQELGYFPFCNLTTVNFVVKSERVKNLLIQSAKTYGITDFTNNVNITIDPNWDKNI